MTEPLGGWKRTHSCGALRAGHVGQDVTLMGWVFRRRDHGGLVFVDLRDREGLTQCVFNPAASGAAHVEAQALRSEFVVAVRGTVQRRPPGTENPRLPTGEVEVEVGELKILNEARPLPFPLEEESDVDELVRFRHRYLDMRRPKVYQNFVIRDQVCQAVRDHLHAHGFVEVETPFLTRSTPEGARDFLVPSRLSRGSFYALPQSPQLFKQLLMVGGVERYFQIVRCFRDEDLRRDRQPEFTQIDIETAFLDRDDFLPIIEGMVAAVFRRVKGIDLPLPFPRLTYAEARARFGSDKPDLRFGMELHDLSDLFRGGGVETFAQAIASGGAVRVLRVPGAERISRKELDDLITQAKALGARGLAWAKVTERGLQSPLARGLEPVRAALLERCGAAVGDLLLLIADATETALTVLGRLRVEVAQRLGLIEAGHYRPAWVVDFPLFGYNAEEQRLDPGTRCTTRSPLRVMRISRSLIPSPAGSSPRPTTWCSTGKRLPAGASEFIRPTSSKRCSR